MVCMAANNIQMAMAFASTDEQHHMQEIHFSQVMARNVVKAMPFTSVVKTHLHSWSLCSSPAQVNTL